jgi:hypothetical protein
MVVGAAIRSSCTGKSGVVQRNIRTTYWKRRLPMSTPLDGLQSCFPLPEIQAWIDTTKKKRYD